MLSKHSVNDDDDDDDVDVDVEDDERTLKNATKIKKHSILEYFTMKAFIFKCNKMLSGTIEISCRSCCLCFALSSVVCSPTCWCIYKGNSNRDRK